MPGNVPNPSIPSFRPLKAEFASLKAKWDAEKSAVTEMRNLKEKTESLKTEEAQAQRAGNLERAATIQYGELVETQKKT